jgi:release factor glutamine methyltransferase
MTQQEPWTIGRLLSVTADYLKRHGSGSPRLDAELLLAHVCDCQRIELYTRYEQIVDDDTRGRFRELVKRRSEGAPVAYLLGRREFYSLNLVVTPDVLIPRPETEFAVIAVLDRLKARPADASPTKVIDIGTGSGAIAIAVAKHATNCEVTAVDLSASALAIARTNAEAHGLSERIRFIESDLLAGVPEEERFDIVVSNPPYVGRSESEQLPREVKEYEPELALFGGEVGDETIGRLIPQAAERLTAGGWLIMELSPMIEPRVRKLLEADGHWQNLSVVKDLAQLARIIVAQRS